ncbi:unnamed protein product, partial [Ixodes persulcatus]
FFFFITHIFDRFFVFVFSAIVSSISLFFRSKTGIDPQRCFDVTRTAMNIEEIKEQYLRDFLPRQYREHQQATIGLRSFYQRELHYIFNSPVSESWRTLLDVGCGPTVANIFPATRKIRSIVLSDLVPRNREEVKKWIEEAPDAMDWSFMSEPLAILEGYK